VNEDDLLKSLQQYFLQNRDTVQRQYDPSQSKVWTDSYSLPDLYNNLVNQNMYSDKQQQALPNTYQEHNDMTLRRLLEQRHKKIRM